MPETGTVGQQTWDEIYDQYSGIENTTLRSGETFPGNNRNIRAVFAANGNSRQANSSIQATNYGRTTTLTQFPGRDLSIGAQDSIRQEVVR